jgi:hypothetical protein
MPECWSRSTAEASFSPPMQLFSFKCFRRLNR